MDKSKERESRYHCIFRLHRVLSNNRPDAELFRLFSVVESLSFIFSLSANSSNFDRLFLLSLLLLVASTRFIQLLRRNFGSSKGFSIAVPWCFFLFLGDAQVSSGRLPTTAAA